MAHSTLAPLSSPDFPQILKAAIDIRSEMHEEEQRLDREQIDEDEENERQYRRLMDRLQLWGEVNTTKNVPAAKPKPPQPIVAVLDQGAAEIA